MGGKCKAKRAGGGEGFCGGVQKVWRERGLRKPWFPDLGTGFSLKYRSCWTQFPELQNPEFPSSGLGHGPELGISVFYRGDWRSHQIDGFFPISAYFRDL